MPTGPIHRTDFNDLIVDSVQETIEEVLGKSVSKAYWYHLQSYLGISKDEIPYRFETLFSSLRDSFGIGGDTLGRAIIRKLYAKAGVELVLVPNRALPEYVEDLKQKLAETLMRHPANGG